MLAKFKMLNKTKQYLTDQNYSDCFKNGNSFPEKKLNVNDSFFGYDTAVKCKEEENLSTRTQKYLEELGTSKLNRMRHKVNF